MPRGQDDIKKALPPLTLFEYTNAKAFLGVLSPGVTVQPGKFAGVRPGRFKNPMPWNWVPVLVSKLGFCTRLGPRAWADVPQSERAAAATANPGAWPNEPRTEWRFMAVIK